MPLREGIDLATPAGRLQVQILGALAEFERELIRERVRAGLANARARALGAGGPSAGPGATWMARKVRRLRVAGRSWRSIARGLKVPMATVRRAGHASSRIRLEPGACAASMCLAA